MKANELRFGNYIMARSDKVIEQVIGIKKNKINACNDTFFVPIPLTEEWLIKFGYENWGIIKENEYESYKRYVLHNFVDGTSNHEVHIIASTYGGANHIEWTTSIDQDERQRNGKMDSVHHLQNAVYKETDNELILKE